MNKTSSRISVSMSFAFLGSLSLIGLISGGCGVVEPLPDDAEADSAEVQQALAATPTDTPCTNNGHCPVGQTCEDYDCNGQRHCALPGQGGPGTNCCTQAGSCAAGSYCCTMQGPIGEGRCIANNQQCTQTSHCDPGTPFGSDTSLCNPLGGNAGDCSSCGTCDGACACEYEQEINGCMSGLANNLVNMIVGLGLGVGDMGCNGAVINGLKNHVCDCIVGTAADSNNWLLCEVNGLLDDAGVLAACGSELAVKAAVDTLLYPVIAAQLTGYTIGYSTCMIYADLTFSSCLSGCVPATLEMP